MNNLEESGFESIFPEDDRNRDPCNQCEDIKRERIVLFLYYVWSNDITMKKSNNNVKKFSRSVYIFHLTRNEIAGRNMFQFDFFVEVKYLKDSWLTLFCRFIFKKSIYYSCRHYDFIFSNHVFLKDVAKDYKSFWLSFDT